MKKRIYEVVLTETNSIQLEAQQGLFMSKVFALAEKSNLTGHGLEITWTNAEDK